MQIIPEFIVGAVARVRGITKERLAEAMEELGISEKFRNSIHKIQEGNPKEVIKAVTEAQKELASWAGIDRKELTTLQREEYMARKELRPGIEKINRRSMSRIHRKLTRTEKEFEELEASDRTLLVCITQKVRQLSDSLIALERIALNAPDESVLHMDKRFFRSLNATRASISVIIALLARHVSSLKSLYGLEAKLALGTA